MKDKPNIILILTDQHRLSALGCYGPTPCRTPHIDRLASEGIRFETAYTVCPVCSPARASIMTGLYPHAHGICSNIYNLGNSVHELTDHPDLLSRRLQSAGYRCGYTGKWHLGEGSHGRFELSNPASLPKDTGFEGQNFPGHGGGGFHYPEYKEYLEKNGFSHEVSESPQSEVWRCGILSGSEESTVPHFLTNNSIELLDAFKQADEPFFIWHNTWGPHSPYYVPQEYYDLYKDVEIPEWPNYDWKADGGHASNVKRHPRADQLTWEDWEEAIRYYYAFTTLIDHQIGRLLDHLEETGLADNTIIIFAADHGETLGSHGGLTDKGWHHFEEIQRIPMIIKTPEKHSSVSNEFVSLVDIYPTILEMAGAKLPERPVHGESLVPLIENRKIKWRDAVFVEFGGVNNLSTTMVSVRKGELKYGWNGSGADELYDLSSDPYEMENVIEKEEYSNNLLTLRQLLSDWMQQTGHPALSMYQFSCLNNLGHIGK